MAKGKRKRRHGGHGAPPAATHPESILAELESITREIAAMDPDSAGPRWGAAHKLLLKTAADPKEVGRIIATRDQTALDRALRQLKGESPPEEPAAATAADEVSAVPAVSAETMKKALRAFRKRLKLTRLDHESRLGVGPMTGGRKAEVDAILPPLEYGPEVWQALVVAGHLRAAGQGFYMLADEASGD